LSGSGKSSAVHILEDAGYFAIDNLPGPLLPRLLDLLSQTRAGSLKKMVLVMDARDENFVRHFENYLHLLKERSIDYKIIFFDTTDDVLLRRFSETRRRHPLSPNGRVSAGIQKERELLYHLKKKSDYLIDTSKFTIHDLKKKLLPLFQKKETPFVLPITLMSFGYRFGIPTDADLVFDVRFLPNPHFIKHLKHHSGQNSAVSRYVLKQKITQSFLKHLRPLLKLLLKNYRKEGKSYITIAFGCTGGRHRSVVLAELMAKDLKQEGYPVRIDHRDVTR